MNELQDCWASGRNKSATDVTALKESDLRQVELRRQICPQISILNHGRLELAGRLLDSTKTIRGSLTLSPNAKASIHVQNQFRSGFSLFDCTSIRHCRPDWAIGLVSCSSKRSFGFKGSLSRHFSRWTCYTVRRRKSLGYVCQREASFR